MYQIATILEAYKNIDEEIIELATEKVKKEIAEKYPEIDLSNENTMDFVVRPIVAILLYSEIEKNSIQSLSSIDGIVNSNLSDEDKYNALVKYAYNNNLTPISKDWKSLYQELLYFIRNNWFNFKTPVINNIISSVNEIIKIYISDSNSKEMVRNRIPIVQLPDTMVNNFVKNETNQLSIIGNSFSRKDIDRYMLAVNNGTISLPNFIDVYLLSDIKTDIIYVNKEVNGTYILPSKFYINVKHDTKEIAIDNSDVSFMYGITNRPLKIFITNGENTEQVQVTYFNIPSIPDIEDVINTSNLIYKAFFPLLVNIDVYTELPIDEEKNNKMFSEIKQYNKSKNFSIDINLVDLNAIVRKYYSDGLCSTNVDSELYLAPGIKYKKDIVFPITVNDLNKDINFPLEQLSENTVALIINDVRVTNEG